MGKLDGKVAIITGANAGIGKATAELMAKEKATVVLVARRADKLKEAEAQIKAAGGKALAITADVTSGKDCKDVFNKIMTAYGKVDVLVNNAGIADGLIGTMRCTDENWNNVIETNQTAVYLFCREALKYMQENNSGSIINISSIGGVYCMAGVAYSASKRAVIGMTRNIAIQFVGTGIRCNAVCPGATMTDMLKNPGKPQDESMFASAMKRGDMSAGFCEPMDIAKAILFFASDDSSAITGQYLVVDKGSLI